MRLDVEEDHEAPRHQEVLLRVPKDLLAHLAEPHADAQAPRLVLEGNQFAHVDPTGAHLVTDGARMAQPVGDTSCLSAPRTGRLVKELRG